MTAPLFLAPHAALVASDEVRLDGPEGRHAVAVRRLAVGESVDLTDGAGLLVSAVVTGTEGKDVLRVVVVGRTEVAPPEPRFTVVQALPKGDRGELAVEMLTEAGADVVVPWAAERCVTRWKGERGQKALGRWRSTAREAAKQARRPWHPQVAELAGTEEVVALLAAAACPLVLHEEAESSLAAVHPPPAGDVVLVVGPEGGLSTAEVEALTGAGARAVRMGPTVLRTSTAGVVALGVLLSRTGRWP